ncbi:MAG: outer membrane protein insertion porin family, partial [Qipengyuania sp.]
MTNFASAATRRNPAARLAIGLLASTMLAGVPTAVLAQEEAASVP